MPHTAKLLNRTDLETKMRYAWKIGMTNTSTDSTGFCA